MEPLKRIAEEATTAINSVLDAPMRPDQSDKVRRVIEQAVIKGMLEGQHRAVDACIDMPEAEKDTAHKIASAIRQSNDALIANLASLR